MLAAFTHLFPKFH